MPVDVRTTSGWKTIGDEQVGSYLRMSEFVFAYDQIRTSPRNIELLDLATPVFLDDVPRFGSMRRSIGDRELVERLGPATAALRRIPVTVDLWDWSDSATHRSSLAAVFIACRFKGYSSASFTKMLHRKRPRLIPILDSQFLDVWYGEGRRWGFENLVDVVFDLGSALRERETSRTALRAIADGLGSPYSGLSTLRLYDIVSYWLSRR